jgi:ribonuclease HI
MGYGVYIDGGEVQKEFSGYSGKGTPFKAEVLALKNVLEFLKHFLGTLNTPHTIVIRGDNQAVIEIMNKTYTIAKENACRLELLELQRLLDSLRVQCLKAGHRLSTLEWVPREQNKKADILSKQGIHNIYD